MVKRLLANLFDTYKVAQVHGAAAALSACIQHAVRRRQITVTLCGASLALPNEPLVLRYIWESVPKLQRLVSAFNIDQVGTIVDVGANCGIFCALAGLRWPTAKLYAFEPDSRLHSFIEQNSKQLNIEVLPVALAATETTADFFINLDASPVNSLLKTAVELFAKSESIETIQVNTATLDRFCEEKGIAEIDVLKVDIQGGESLFIRGAERSIRLTRCAAFEISFLDEAALELSQTLLQEFAGYSAVNHVAGGADVLFWRESRDVIAGDA